LPRLLGFAYGAAARATLAVYVVEPQLAVEAGALLLAEVSKGVPVGFPLVEGGSGEVRAGVADGVGKGDEVLFGHWSGWFGV